MRRKVAIFGLSECQNHARFLGCARHKEGRRRGAKAQRTGAESGSPQGVRSGGLGGGLGWRRGRRRRGLGGGGGSEGGGGGLSGGGRGSGGLDATSKLSPSSKSYLHLVICQNVRILPGPWAAPATKESGSAQGCKGAADGCSWAAPAAVDGCGERLSARVRSAGLDSGLGVAARVAAAGSGGLDARPQPPILQILLTLSHSVSPAGLRWTRYLPPHPTRSRRGATDVGTLRGGSLPAHRRLRARTMPTDALRTCVRH